MQCNNCSREINTENDLKRSICFACHVKGITFTFTGAQYGKENWNTSTIKEAQKMYENMPGVEKVSSRKELI